MVVYKIQRSQWLSSSRLRRFGNGVRLKDERARGMIASRLDRLAFGNAGDVKPVGQGISELRIDYGPGYRIYCKRVGNSIILLLCGGDKRTQANDIETAKRLAKEWSEEGA